MAEPLRTSPIYRLLHSAPMLFGVPALWALVLILLTAASMALGFFLGAVGLCIGIGNSLVLWLIVAISYGRDRVVPALRLLRKVVPARTASFSRSRQSIREEP